MAKMGLREAFEMQTRDRFTKVNCELGLTVEGKELPNMAILGEALEEAIAMINTKVQASYTKVPERTGDTPIATPTF